MSDAANKIMNELLKHCEYIDSIADLIGFTYPREKDFGCKDILKMVGNNKTYFNTMNKDHDFSLALRNLRNAWYHESAFIQDDTSDTVKMKFTAWKIIQFYYGIFCAISSIVRCETNEEMGHNIMINYFTNNLLRNRDLHDFFPPPFCFVLDQNGKIKPEFNKKIDWEHGLQIKCPSIEKCLNEIYIDRTTSIFHYFLQLRNWVNYQDTYIFRRFYGETIKPAMYSNMHMILSTFVSIAEIFLMCAINFDKINDESKLYIKDFVKYMEDNITYDHSVTLTLTNRFKYYASNKEWFNGD